MAAKPIYRVKFINAGTIYEIYAKKIAHSNMVGFIEAEEFMFNTKTQVVVDPAEERLKAEFANVKRTYIPMHAVIRIDEVNKEGTSKIHDLSDAKGKVSPFPSVIYTPAKVE